MKFAHANSGIRIVAAMLVAVVAHALAGCATTTVNAQWTDPEFAGRSLRGQNVLVVCDADSPAAKRICQDAMAVRLRGAGVTPIIATAEIVAGPPPTNDKALAAARAAGASAILATVVGPDASYVSPGAGVGVGVGGGSGGYGRGGGVSFGGISIGFPIGGGSVSTSYSANVVLTDVASARMMWSGKVSTPAAQDVNAQMGELARVAVDAARTSGFF